MVDPLPQLGPADLRSGCILHQIEKRNASNATQPGFQIADAHRDILFHPCLGDLGFRHSEQVDRRDIEIFKFAADLVGLGHISIENLFRKRDQARVRHPGAIMTVGSFAFLISSDLLHRRLIRHRIFFVRNISGHAAHGMNFPAMASLDQQLAIAAQEMSRHGYAPAVRQNIFGIVGELLDEAENIVPASGIQARRMLAQFIQDFVHLKGSQDGLNENRGFDGAARDSQRRL